jgi:pimeloyl-ACP methyl ester carboxylesterase
MNSNTVSFLKGNIHYYTQGKGRCIVLLHGFLGSSEIWKKIVPILSKSYKVVCIDLPGHGKSDCLGYAHSMELMADAVFAVLKKLRIIKCVMVGHSMGGYVTLAFAKKYPEYLKGFCLFHSTAHPDSEEKKKDRNKAIKIVRNNPRLFIKPMIKNLFAKRNIKYLSDEIKFATDIALKTPVQGIIAALVGMRDRPSYISVLSDANYPIMMIIGKQDNVLPYNVLLEQCELIKEKHCLFLEYDGHFGMLENPNATGIALRQFARKCFNK